MSKRSVLCIVISIFVCYVVLFVLKPNISYNNTELKTQLISEKYSDAQIDEMIKKIDEQMYREYEFIKEYDIECLRKTTQDCYYAVFQKEDGEFVYVFLDDGLVPSINVTLIVDRFKSKEEFSNFVSIDRSASDMIAFDPSTLFPFSGRLASIHHVVEGVFLVDYYPNNDPWYKGKVAHVEFIEVDEELLMKDSGNIPYILSIDRQD